MCGEAARGIQDVQLRTGIPCAFGVLTVDTLEQALARAGGDKRDSGRNAAEAVLALLKIKQKLAASAPRAAPLFRLGRLSAVTLEIVAILLTLVVHVLGAVVLVACCSTARRSTGGRACFRR